MLIKFCVLVMIATSMQAAATVYATGLRGGNQNPGGPVSAAVDSAGNTWVTWFGRSETIVPPTVQNPNPRPNVRWGSVVAKVKADGSSSSGTSFEYSSPAGLVLTQDGGVYLVSSETEQAFLIRLAPDLSVRYRKALDDTPNAVATGSDGAVYVAGRTRCTAQSCSDAVVLKYRPDGELEWRKVFGGSGTDLALSIAVDAAGAAVVTGSTESTDFPVTVGALQSVAGGTASARGFAARLDPTGQTLTYSTFLGGSGKSQASRVTLDAAGSAYIAGSTTAEDFPASPGAFQTKTGGGQDGFLMKLDTQGTAHFATYLGGAGEDAATSLALDDNRLYVAVGGPVAARFTGRAPTPCDPDFVLLAVDAVSGRVTDSFAPRPIGRFDSMVYGSLAVDSKGLLHIGGRSSGAYPRLMALPLGYLSNAGDAFLMRVDWGAREGMAPACLVNGATLIDEGMRLGAGEVVSIFGRGIGPDEAVIAQPEADGRYPRALAGVRVLLDGIALPLFYVSERQVNFVVPYSRQPASFPGAQLSLEYGGQEATWPATVANVMPGAFLSSLGDAIAVNEDGSLNSAQRPAAHNSVIALFATGLGALDSAWPDDAVRWDASTWPDPKSPVLVTFERGGYAQVLHSGPARGTPPGVYRIDVRVPSRAASGRNRLQFFIGSVFVDPDRAGAVYIAPDATP